ncbi:hypothetical [Yersinia pestis KIM10+]|uniref:Uncharacterized protein n=3 Tax=Yersinia pestis TaxID=632 RepID=Q8CKT9_YERPE|nr:hypothetical [Yersinia pestis KIM10+]
MPTTLSVLPYVGFPPMAQELIMLIIRLYGCPVFIGFEPQKPPIETTGVKNGPTVIKSSISQ